MQGPHWRPESQAVEWGWAAPLVPTPASALPPPCQCQGQTPASLTLSRPLGSPCRRFWSESERKAGRGPPLRKIMASRPRKSALRPVYSSPPRVRVGGRVRGGGPGPVPRPHPFPVTSAGSHPCHARPGLGITHLQRCWRRDGWARVGTSPAHFPHCGAPDGAHAGEREGGREGEASPRKAEPAPTRAAAIACGWRVGVGGRRPHSGPCRQGQFPGTKVPFRL